MISDLIKKEAYVNCQNKNFSSFICLIALSSVIKKQIHSIYPDFGLEKCKKLFNVIINPRVGSRECTSNIFFGILWCNTDSSSTVRDKDKWSPNHLVTGEALICS